MRDMDREPREWPKWGTCIHYTLLNKQCSFCVMDGELTGMPDSFWCKLLADAQKPNPYGSISTKPERQWTEQEIKAGKAIGRAVANWRK